MLSNNHTSRVCGAYDSFRSNSRAKLAHRPAAAGTTRHDMNTSRRSIL
jgi:hypothetical protein